MAPTKEQATAEPTPVREGMASEGGPRPRLLALSGPLMGRILLIQADTTLGREVGCTIVLDDRAVSRRHARISSEGDLHAIEDLGSTNGTWVNELRVPAKAPTPLVDGCKLRLGRSVFRYRRRVSPEELTSEIDDLAKRDPDSGLYNRFHFMARGRVAVGEAPARGASLSLLLVTFPDLQDIADERRALAAQDVLREAGQRIRAACRVGDTPARLAHGELAILLPDTTEETAERIADELLAGLERIVRRYLGKRRGVAIGGTTIQPAQVGHLDDFATLVASAEQAARAARSREGIVVRPFGGN